MSTVLITGGTGLVGRALTTFLLKQGYDVIVLTRKQPAATQKIERVEYALWDIEKKEVDIPALLRADHIVHLAGAGVVDKAWTKSYQQKILDSRTESIGLLIENLAEHNHHVKTLVSASAIGWYGPDTKPGFAFTEDDPAAKDFLGETCKRWEDAADKAETLGIRVCKLRTGIVLGDQGGALSEFEKPLQFGIAAILGSGEQMVSWIHLTDICRMYIHAIENSVMHGSYNAVAPQPISNKTLTLHLAKRKRGKSFMAVHVPSFVLKLMMGQRSAEVLKSTTVSCAKIKGTGFTFIFPSIDAALGEIVRKEKQSTTNQS